MKRSALRCISRYWPCFIAIYILDWFKISSQCAHTQYVIPSFLWNGFSRSIVRTYFIWTIQLRNSIFLLDIISHQVQFGKPLLKKYWIIKKKITGLKYEEFVPLNSFHMKFILFIINGNAFQVMVKCSSWNPNLCNILIVHWVYNWWSQVNVSILISVDGLIVLAHSNWCYEDMSWLISVCFAIFDRVFFIQKTCSFPSIWLWPKWSDGRGLV